ncbi:MAG: sugar phosphate isomerase/epimerase family protein [Armatimonadota bacterium]|jgi:2-keto-myo-inositol isomerase
MRTCLNTATTRGKPLDDDIRLCGEVGFEGIEIDTGKLDEYARQGGTVADLRALLAESGVECVGLMAFAFAPFGEHEEELDRIRRYAPVCRDLGGTMLLTYIADQPEEGLAREVAIERAAWAATSYAEVAQEFGLKIALEPIGGREFMGGPDDALAVIEASGHPALGIMVDTFHYHKSGVAPERVAQLPADQILIVHINDAEDLPAGRLVDANRLYPGLGILPLHGYLDALEQAGWDGFLSVEIFREEYWLDEHENIVRNAKTALDRVLNQRR